MKIRKFTDESVHQHLKQTPLKQTTLNFSNRSNPTWQIVPKIRERKKRKIEDKSHYPSTDNNRHKVLRSDNGDNMDIGRGSRTQNN